MPDGESDAAVEAARNAFRRMMTVGLARLSQATHAFEVAIQPVVAERDRLRSAIEDHRAVASSRNHASPADYELWEALDA